MVGLLDGTKEAIYASTDFVGGEMGGGKWMRQGDLKAVMVPAPYGKGVWQLFDVAADPGEAKDLSKADPGEAKDLSKQLPDELETLKAAWDQYAKDVGVVLGE
jgi:arylsulfatase